MTHDRNQASAARPARSAGASALLLPLVLAACGGGADEAAEALFDNHGRPAATASTPPAGGQQTTRAGLYATARQYAQEALLSSAYTVLIDVDAFDGEDAAVAGAMAAHAVERVDPAEQQAYFVKAADPRSAVRVADALTARGLAHVFLLTDDASRMPSNPSTR